MIRADKYQYIILAHWIILRLVCTIINSNIFFQISFLQQTFFFSFAKYIRNFHLLLFY